MHLCIILEKLNCNILGKIYFLSVAKLFRAQRWSPPGFILVL